MEKIFKKQKTETLEAFSEVLFSACFAASAAGILHKTIYMLCVAVFVGYAVLSLYEIIIKLLLMQEHREYERDEFLHLCYDRHHESADAKIKGPLYDVISIIRCLMYLEGAMLAVKNGHPPIALVCLVFTFFAGVIIRCCMKHMLRYFSVINEREAYVLTSHLKLQYETEKGWRQAEEIPPPDKEILQQAGL